MAFAEGHPAREALIARAVCQRDCAGREIPWPGKEHLATDLEWQSSVDGRQWKFSGFIYAHICFDLVLSEWITHPKFVTENERHALNRIPQMSILLAECERAASQAANDRVLEMIPIAKRFFELWEQSIRLRIQQDKLEVEDEEDRV